MDLNGFHIYTYKESIFEFSQGMITCIVTDLSKRVTMNCLDAHVPRLFKVTCTLSTIT
jgi:hypothetical protein